MKSMCWLLILALFVYIGCSSMEQIVYHEAESYRILNEEVEGKKASVTLFQGQTYSVENVKIHQDSTYWVDFNTRKPQSVLTVTIREINTKTPGRGIALGALGLVVGGIAGCLIGLLGVNIAPGEEESGVKVVPGMVTGSAIGGLLGMLQGYKVGKSHQYIFIKPGAARLFKEYQSEIIFISDRVGESIDLEEYERFHLDSLYTIEEFQEAVLLKLIDGNYYLKISYTDNQTGNRKEKWILLTDREKKKFEEHIKRYE
jgi:hypothetical protein